MPFKFPHSAFLYVVATFPANGSAPPFLLGALAFRGDAETLAAAVAHPGSPGRPETLAVVASVSRERSPGRSVTFDVFDSAATRTGGAYTFTRDNAGAVGALFGPLASLTSKAAASKLAAAFLDVLPPELCPAGDWRAAAYVPADAGDLPPPAPVQGLRVDLAANQARALDAWEAGAAPDPVHFRGLEAFCLSPPVLETDGAVLLRRRTGEAYLVTLDTLAEVQADLRVETLGAPIPRARFGAALAYFDPSTVAGEPGLDAYSFRTGPGGAGAVLTDERSGAVVFFQPGDDVTDAERALGVTVGDIPNAAAASEYF